jgi:hypothetical protein
MLAIQRIISFHATNFGPIRSLRQEKLKGEELSTCATVACLDKVKLVVCSLTIVLLII